MRAEKTGLTREGGVQGWAGAGRTLGPGSASGRQGCPPCIPPWGGTLPAGLSGEHALSRSTWALQTPEVFLVCVGRGGLMHWVLLAE